MYGTAVKKKLWENTHKSVYITVHASSSSLRLLIISLFWGTLFVVVK